MTDFDQFVESACERKLPTGSGSNQMTWPKYYRWGGGGVKRTWSFGWLTGRDKDLICVERKITASLPIAETFLSPVCSTRLLALWAFILKGLVVRIDYNVKDLER